LDVLVVLPWWVSVLSAVAVYIAFAIVIPAIVIGSSVLQGWALAAPTLAPVLSLILLAPAPISAFNAWRKRKLLDTQRDLTSIRALTWREFEELVAEAYRRQGYRVIENHRGGADGGVDIRLKKDGSLHLIQCKQWRSAKIGVRVVRELYGVMSAEHALRGVVISSGVFTQEAKNFAAGKPIDLIDGLEVAQLVRGVQAVPVNHPGTPEAVVTRLEACPQCGSTLVRRFARKGKNAGQEFIGCSSFPRCRYTQNI